MVVLSYDRPVILLQTEEVNEMVYYFAYGSNMSREEIEKAKGIEATGRCRAFLPGYARVFDKKTSLGLPGEGKANITPDPNSTVEGVLYQINEDELAFLDDKERGYDRIAVSVSLSDGRTIEAQMYQAQEKRRDPSLKPTKEYMSRLLAARDILSPETISELEAVETLD